MLADLCRSADMYIVARERKRKEGVRERGTTKFLSLVVKMNPGGLGGEEKRGSRPREQDLSALGEKRASC